MGLFAGENDVELLDRSHVGRDINRHHYSNAEIHECLKRPVVRSFSKGISCFPKAQHGAVAGVILFFTCVSAALGPLAMGAVGDAFHSARAGFVLATGFATAQFVLLLFNFLRGPAKGRLLRQENEYVVENGGKYAVDHPHAFHTNSAP